MITELEVQLYDPAGKPVFTAPLVAHYGESKNQRGGNLYPASEIHFDSKIREPEVVVSGNALFI